MFRCFFLLALLSGCAKCAVIPGELYMPSRASALGMHDRTIRDEDITGSSQWYKSIGPQYSRLQHEEGSSVWCPVGLLQPEDVQFPQIDLHNLPLVVLAGNFRQDS
ncbi:hypothetical protein XELAEV_18002174mg [Xenopus laevis]|uniref:F5/8 type C domain-containing protein n=1 Tax=Xenopus laevis TaxID=8355 RepID=A0A974BNK0_XENLA|nr:hypothetical protein XELAEV_18002174mg [Xenopus laevis]